MSARGMAARTLAVLVVALAAVGCEDSIIKLLGPENNESVTDVDGVFRYQATELDNVHDVRRYTWENPQPRALVVHRNFVHHGSVLILVHDGAGGLVDSTFAEWELDAPTDAGVPGTWDITFHYYGARGRVDTSLEPLAAP